MRWSLIFILVLASLANSSASPDTSLIRYPVLLHNDTLLYISHAMGSHNAKARAQQVSNAVLQLYDDETFSADSLYTASRYYGADILARNEILMAITVEDTTGTGMTPLALANSYAVTIAQKISQEREVYTVQNILKRFALLALTLLVSVFIVLLINRLFRFVKTKTLRLGGKSAKGVHLRQYQLLNKSDTKRFLSGVIDTVRLAAILLMLYLLLPVLFSIFPETRDIAELLLEWTWNPLKKLVLSIFGYLPNLLTIVVIFVIIRYVLKLISFFAGEIEKGSLRIPGFYPDWARPTFNIVRILLYAFMFVVIFPYLPGSDSVAFKGVSVFLGILFSLGSYSALSNLVSGLVITYMRPFKIGDFIKLGEVSGDVIEKNMLLTRIRTIQFEEITIPNLKVLNSHIINYSANTLHGGLIMNSTVTIRYDIDWRTVHRLLVEAALATKGIEQEPAPYVLQTSLDDFYVSYKINATTLRPNDTHFIYSELHQHIQDVFKAAGIEIVSPHFRSFYGPMPPPH